MPEATSATDRPHVGNPKLSGTFKHCAVQHEAVSAQVAATQRCRAAVFLGRFLPKLGGASRCRPFFTYAGRARGAPLSHGSQNGVNRTYDFVPCSSGHLVVAMGSVGQLGKGAYGLSVAPRCSRLQNSARARAPADVPLMGNVPEPEVASMTEAEAR